MQTIELILRAKAFKKNSFKTKNMAFIVQAVEGKENLLRLLLENLNLVASVEEQNKEDWAKELTAEQLDLLVKSQKELLQGEQVHSVDLRASSKAFFEAKKSKQMIDVIWSSTARNQYFEQLNYLYDHFGESTALKFQEKVFKIEDQLATGLVKYPASKQLGLEKCVLDKYNALIFQRDKEQIRIVLLINNRSDWDY